MTHKHLSTRFNVREDLIDNITPNTTVQEEIRAPHGHWKPAAWLPVQFTKSNARAGTDAFVISSGKPVCMDTEGRLVPSGMRSALGGDGATSVFAGTVLTYTSTDVTYGVVDLTTGARVTAAVTYDGEELADALIERGLVREADAVAAGGTVPVTNDAHVNVVIDLFLSRSVGIVADDTYVWAGLVEDGDQWFTNYGKQHGVQFLTEVQMKVPHRVAGNTTADAFDIDALDTAGTETFAAGSAVAAGEYWDVTNVRQIARYSALSATAPVAALGLAEAHVAPPTDRTPFTADDATMLIRQRLSPSDISKAGDWYLDADVGVLFIHTTTFDTLDAGTVTVTLTYDFYTTSGTATGHRHVHLDGDVRPGDYVKVDAQSNFVKAVAADLSAGDLVLGQVLQIQKEPRPLLNEVKTAWTLDGMTAASRMPGSATKGFTDLITLSGETVADAIAIINVRI